VKVPPKSEAPGTVNPLLTQLETGTDEEKIKAAEQLAALGDKSTAVARALCRAAISSNKEVSRSALQALEKVAPDLYEPVFTLVVDGQAASHRKAIAALREQGPKAKAAIPVLLFQLQKHREDITDSVEGRRTAFGSGGFRLPPGSSLRMGWASNTLFEVITDQMTALPQIAPEDPEVLQAVIRTTRVSFTRQLFLPTGGSTTTPFRGIGVGLLGELAAKRPEHRKQIIPELVTILEETVQGLNAGDLRKLAEVGVVSQSLMKCGPDAKDTLTKKVIPQLKELEFHKDAAVRAAAKGLRKRIEAGPAPVGKGVLETGRLQKQDQLAAIDSRDKVRQNMYAKRYTVRFLAGKTYQIDMVSNEGNPAILDPYLRLEDPKGAQVAADDDGGGFPNARITYAVQDGGQYTIVCTTFGPNQTGRYTLTVQER
jgi:hypothetical protein